MPPPKESFYLQLQRDSFSFHTVDSGNGFWSFQTNKPCNLKSLSGSANSGSVDVGDKLHFVGVPNKEAKFHPTGHGESIKEYKPDVREDNPDNYREVRSSLPEPKNVEYFQAKPKELDDDTSLHPIDDDVNSQSLDQVTFGTGAGSTTDDHEVADDLGKKPKTSHTQKNVKSKITSSSKSNRRAKKKRKQRQARQENSHKRQYSKKPKNVPHDTVTAGGCTEKQDANEQTAQPTKNRGNVKRHGTSRLNILGGEGCGGDSDSDKSWGSKERIPDDYDSGTDQDAEMISESYPHDSVTVAKDDCEPATVQSVRERWDRVGLQKQVSVEAIEKAKQDFMRKLQTTFAELTPVFQKLTHQVSQNVIHSAYCLIEECPQGPICQWIKNTLIPHILHHQEKQTCDLCKCGNAALYIHTLRCQVPGYCDVWQCSDIKQAIQDAAKKKDFAKGTVLYSATNLWKEGQVIFEDEDYCFLLKKPVGKGQYGTAYRAWFYDCRTSCEADVAVKEARYKLHEEATVVKMLGTGNPYILQTQAIVNWDNRGDSGLVIMELCECSLLDYLYDYIKQHNTRGLKIEDAIYFFVQIVDGVAYMHSKRIIHKDLKAKNVFLINNFQRIKIGDWDAAIPLIQEMTRANMSPKGTPGYAAPEVVDKMPHGFPADIFSLGCCLLELLFGNQHSITKEGREKEISELATRDPELAELVACCVADNPEDRPTAKEILCNPVIRKYLQGNKPISPEPFRIAGMHMRNEKVFKACIDEQDYPIELRDKAARVHGCADEGVLKMMDDLPKELPPINGPSTSSWGRIIQCPTSDDEQGEMIVQQEREDGPSGMDHLSNSLEAMETNDT